MILYIFSELGLEINILPEKSQMLSQIKNFIVSSSKRTYQVRPVRPLFSRKLLKIPKYRSKTVQMPMRNKSMGKMNTYPRNFKLFKNFKT